MNAFWNCYERGEIYMVRGELMVLRGYLEGSDLAVMEDEYGERRTVAPGLIRVIASR